VKFMRIIHTIIAVVTVIFAVALASCGNKADNKAKPLPTDLINNPASAGNKNASGQLPAMKFGSDEHDFGRLVQGETVSYGFTFTNTGGSDLIIASVSSSCGCTVTEYPKEPVAPGKQGVITVTFKTEGKRGFQHKTVTVMANTQPNTKVLKISAEIRLPEEG